MNTVENISFSDETGIEIALNPDNIEVCIGTNQDGAFSILIEKVAAGGEKKAILSVESNHCCRRKVLNQLKKVLEYIDKHYQSWLAGYQETPLPLRGAGQNNHRTINKNHIEKITGTLRCSGKYCL